MRIGVLALAAACAAALPQAASAETVVFSFSAYASGAETVTFCSIATTSCLDTVTPLQRLLEGSWASELVGGVATFEYGHPRGGGVYRGTVLRVGDGLLSGRDFSYYLNIDDGRTCPGQPTCRLSRTELFAPTFSVRQLIPVPVPEPGTWMTMLAGFGAVGAALRIRRKREARPAFA